MVCSLGFLRGTLKIFAEGWDIYPWPSHLTWQWHGDIGAMRTIRRPVAPGECRGSQSESSWSQSLPEPSRGRMIFSQDNMGR